MCAYPERLRRAPFCNHSNTFTIMNSKKTKNEADARLADAVENDDLEAATAALDAGATPDGRCTRRRDNLPPLFVAVLHSQPDMVRLLLERGANPNIRDNLTIYPDCTPLFEADCACARILLDHGADAAVRDAIGQTALFFDASMYGREARAEEVERVKLLLQAGTPGDAVSRNGSTALFYVHETESVRLLLQAGAPADARAGEYEMLNALCQHHWNPKSTMLLLEAGADPNVTDEEWGCGVCGWDTPVESVRLLLEHGFNPNLMREEFYTTPPIARVVSREVALLLQQAGADVNLRYLACEFIGNWHCLDRKLATTPVGYNLYADELAAAESLLQLPGVNVGMLELYWALRAGEDARLGYRSKFYPAPDTDAAIALLKKYGHLEIDDDTLAAYRADPDSMLTPDFFLDGILKPRPVKKRN